MTLFGFVKWVHSFEAVQEYTSIVFQFLSKNRDLIEKITHAPRAVVDPEFRKGRCANILFGKIYAANCIKMKEIGKLPYLDPPKTCNM